MLTKLGGRQLELLTSKRDEWIKIGSSTERMNFPAARAAIERGYRNAGKNPPKIFLRLDGPWHALIARSLIASGKIGAQVIAQVRAQVSDQVLDQVLTQVRDQVSGQVSGQVIAQVRDQVRDQVSGQVSGQVIAQVRAQVIAQVSDQVRDQVSAQVSGQVRDQVLDQMSAQVDAQVSAQVSAQVIAQVRDQVRDQVRAQVSDQVLDQVIAQVDDQVSAQVDVELQYPNFYGSHEGGWWWGLSYYETMRDLGVTDASCMDPWFDAARECGWCWIYWDIAIVSDRPSMCLLDDRGRLHCSGGPALEYLDGTQVWAWHGVRVPKRVILEPKSYSSEEYRSLPAEHRRSLGEHAGWSWVLDMLGSSPVSVSIADGLSYELIRCSDGSQYLRMQSPILQDGSQPSYLEPVHEGLKTAAGARKWRVARDSDGRWWTPEECESDPSLSLGQHT